MIWRRSPRAARKCAQLLWQLWVHIRWQTSSRLSTFLAAAGLEVDCHWLANYLLMRDHSPSLRCAYASWAANGCRPTGSWPPVGNLNTTYSWQGAVTGSWRRSADHAPGDCSYALSGLSLSKSEWSEHLVALITVVSKLLASVALHGPSCSSPCLISDLYLRLDDVWRYDFVLKHIRQFVIAWIKRTYSPYFRDFPR